MLNRLKIFILVCYLGLASNLLTGCKTAADASSSILSQSRPKSGALTAPQLGAFPIGWQPNGKQLSLALPRSNFNCSYRLGPVYPTTGSQGVDSMSYSPCSLNSQGSLPLTMPRSGQQDGTFRIDVSFDSGSTNEISQSFYVHPS
jgi:hypothetical protein